MTEKEIDIALEWLNDLEEQIEDYCEFPEVQDLYDEDIQRLEKLRLRRDFLNDILVKGTENL